MSRKPEWTLFDLGTLVSASHKRQHAYNTGASSLPSFYSKNNESHPRPQTVEYLSQTALRCFDKALFKIDSLTARRCWYTLCALCITSNKDWVETWSPMRGSFYSTLVTMSSRRAFPIVLPTSPTKDYQIFIRLDGR